MMLKDCLPIPLRFQRNPSDNLLFKGEQAKNTLPGKLSMKYEETYANKNDQEQIVVFLFFSAHQLTKTPGHAKLLIYHSNADYYPQLLFTNI